MTLLQNHAGGLKMTIIWNPIIAPNVSWVPHFNNISSKSGTGTFQPSKGPSPQKPTVPHRNDLTTNKPKPTPFDGCYKCLPFPAHVPTRDRGNSDRNPVPRVKSLSELMDVSLPQEITSLSVAFWLTHLINKKTTWQTERPKFRVATTFDWPIHKFQKYSILTLLNVWFRKVGCWNRALPFVLPVLNTPHKGLYNLHHVFSYGTQFHNNNNNNNNNNSTLSLPDFWTDLINAWKSRRMHPTSIISFILIAMILATPSNISQNLTEKETTTQEGSRIVFQSHYFSGDPRSFQGNSFSWLQLQNR